MTSRDYRHEKIFFHVSVEGRVSKHHLLRPSKAMVEECLQLAQGASTQ